MLLASSCAQARLQHPELLGSSDTRGFWRQRLDFRLARRCLRHRVEGDRACADWWTGQCSSLRTWRVFFSTYYWSLIIGHESRHIVVFCIPDIFSTFCCVDIAATLHTLLSLLSLLIDLVLVRLAATPLIFMRTLERIEWYAVMWWPGSACGHSCNGFGVVRKHTKTTTSNTTKHIGNSGTLGFGGDLISNFFLFWFSFFLAWQIPNLITGLNGW